MTQRFKILTGSVALVILIMGAAFAYITIRGNVSHDDNANTTPLVAEYHKISADEAKRIIDQTDSVILLDVRTDKEFQEQHIPGAILIPDYEISARAETELPNKDELILIYCRSGRRSTLAANELVGMGYTNVYDFGAIIDWPYDVE